MTKPRLTAEQRAALDALPPKRRAFVLAYVGEAAGNGAEAARRAGYTHPQSQAGRVLGFVAVKRAIELLRTPADNAAIATMEELRALWTKWAREGVSEAHVGEGEPPVLMPLEMRDRIKASELLAKSQGGFVDRLQHSGPDDGPVQQEVRVQVDIDAALELASEPPRNHMSGPITDDVSGQQQQKGQE